jgi:uncharacterized protein
MSALPIYKDCFRIRTITCFVTLQSCDFVESGDEQSSCLLREKIQCATSFLRSTEQHFIDAGYTVQTVRIATNSFEEWLLTDEVSTEMLDLKTRMKVMDRRLFVLNKLLLECDINFCSLGPATTVCHVKDCIVPIILSSDRFSVSAAIASHDVTMAKQCAETIKRIASQTKDGLGNFRFCVAAAAGDFIPFFPIAKAATFNSRETNCVPVGKFSIGLENGALVNLLLERCRSISNIPTIFASAMDSALLPVQNICEQLSGEQFEFVGIDTSLNPSLDENGSIAAAIERLDEVENFGSPGTLAAISIITQTIQSLTSIKHCGYSGIMLPVCEDQRLAEITQTTDSNGVTKLRISDLLSISQVCGVGIDTVPIPGDCSERELASLILDVAGVAHRWNKSLSCRVFPVPGKKAGDVTNFDSPYMVNATIMSLSP